jgi:hypothetical protein
MSDNAKQNGNEDNKRDKSSQSAQSQPAPPRGYIHLRGGVRSLDEAIANFEKIRRKS